MPVEN